MLIGLARVLEYGDCKYARDDGTQNWRLGSPAREPIDSMLRHLNFVLEYLNTPDSDRQLLFDEESGLPHVDHIIFNAIALRLSLEQECNLPRDPFREGE